MISFVLCLSFFELEVYRKFELFQLKPSEVRYSRMGQSINKSDFIALLTPSYYKIHGFILSLVTHREDAEDILQSTITYMWEHFEDFEPGTNFLAWGFTIARFQVMTYRKKKKRSHVFFSDKTLQLIASQNQKMSHDMDLRFNYLSQCIKKLRSHDMALINKRYDQNVGVESLAAEMGTSKNVIYKRLVKIKKALMRCVQQSLASGGYA